MKLLFLFTVSMFLTKGFAQSASWPAEAAEAWVDSFSNDSKETHIKNKKDIITYTNNKYFNISFYDLKNIKGLEIDNNNKILSVTYCEENLSEKYDDLKNISHRKDINIAGGNIIYVGSYNDGSLIIDLGDLCNNKFLAINLALNKTTKKFVFSYKYKHLRSLASAPVAGMHIPADNPIKNISALSVEKDTRLFSTYYDITTEPSFVTNN